MLYPFAPLQRTVFATRSKTLIYLLLGFHFPSILMAQYKGTASVSQGKATTVTSNLYSCTGGRIAGVGTVKSTDNKSWTVPAETQFSNTSFPWASDLNNACDGNNYKTATEAISALNGSDIITLDADGEVVTAYIFADNYFEMYVNGVAIGKDKVPFTQFNSSLVRFKVKQPFTVAMLLVDWEENLGLGSELNGGFAYHPGDGGMVAIFKNASGKIIGKTDKSWKAQTFYTAPIVDLSCPTETGQLRSTSACSTADSKDGTAYYALHWAMPVNWMDKNFDDSQWPVASEYSNATIGVDNKPAYTNFTDIFDDASADGQFIWSSNVILDNQVVVRGVIGTNRLINEKTTGMGFLYPNPTEGYLNFTPFNGSEIVKNVQIHSMDGKLISALKQPKFPILLEETMREGLYVVSVETGEGTFCEIVEFRPR